MSETKLAPLSGVVFVLLLGVAALVVRNFTFMPPAERALEIFEDRWAIVGGAYLGALSTFFLLWFAGSLRSFLIAAERGKSRLGSLAFGGGVFAAVAVALGFVLLAAGAERLAVGGGLSGDAATTILDLSGVLTGNAAPFGFAAMLLATAIAVYRTRVMPVWVAWVSGLLAVGLLSPVNWAFLFAPLIWVPAMGIAVSLRLGKGEDDSADHPASTAVVG